MDDERQGSLVPDTASVIIEAVVAAAVVEEVVMELVVVMGIVADVEVVVVCCIVAKVVSPLPLPPSDVSVVEIDSVGEVR